MSDTPSNFTAAAQTGLSVTWLMGFVGWIPAMFQFIAAFALFIWITICIRESKTYIHWSRNRAMKSNARRLMKLKAKERIAVARIEAAEKLRQARVAARDLIDHEIAEAAKLVAQNKIVSKADVIVRQEADHTYEDSKSP